MINMPPPLFFIILEINFKYFIEDGEYSMNFCLWDILKPIFFSNFFIFINLSTNFGFSNFENFTFFSYHLSFFLTNCFTGKASKNSFAINIVGKFDKELKLFIQFTL